MKTTKIKIVGEYITLSQALKQAGVINTGGQAKWYLSENTVSFNGEPENRRGKKLRSGDNVKLPNGDILELI